MNINKETPEQKHVNITVMYDNKTKVIQIPFGTEAETAFKLIANVCKSMGVEYVKNS